MDIKAFSLVCVLALTLPHAIMASANKLDQKFGEASNSFAGELYQKTIEGKTGNVIISPISMQSAVTLTMFGATGETKQEMLRGLKYPTDLSSESIANNFEAFTEQVKATNGLQIANKVYVMESFTVKKSFNDIATKSFASEAQSINFAQSSESAATINEWIEDQTNKKIKDVIKPDMLNIDTRMVLVNAIYFKGLWTYQFKKEDTFKAPFYLDDQKSVTTDFMKIKSKFRFGFLEEHDATAIELPYKNTSISMLIILPNTKTGLPALEGKLNTITFGEISKSLREQEVKVELPKFKIEFDILMNDPLKKMGMKKMFSKGAEFGDLLESAEPLVVSEVIHKAFIEVNEEGAEAAAVTVMRIMKRSLPMNEEFIADHPFIFAIISNGTVNFLGRIKEFSEAMEHDEL